MGALLRRLQILVPAAAAIVLATPMSALADDFNHSADLPTTCWWKNGAEGIVTAPVLRTAAGPRYANGETITFSVAATSVGVHSVTLVDPTITLPDDWQSLAVGTASKDTVRYYVTALWVETGNSSIDQNYTDHFTIDFADSDGNHWTAQLAMPVILDRCACPDPADLFPVNCPDEDAVSPSPGATDPPGAPSPPATDQSGSPSPSVGGLGAVIALASIGILAGASAFVSRRRRSHRSEE